MLRKEALRVGDLAAVVLSAPDAWGVLRELPEAHEHSSARAIMAKLDAGVGLEFVGMDEARIAAKTALPRDPDR